MKCQITPGILVGSLLALSVCIGHVNAGERQTQPKAPPRYVYPFPAYPNPHVQALPDQSAEYIFLAGIPWPSAASTSEPCHLWGVTSNGTASLYLEASQGAWGASWELCPGDETTWTPWPSDFLSLSALPKDVYEVRVTTAFSPAPLPSIWVAWPTNAILPDRTQPNGSVHGEIAKEQDRLRMHVWGYAYDAIQAGLYGSNGVRQARLKIDGNWSTIALDAAGSFDTVVPVRHRPDGVHTVALFANDFAHETLSQIDAEYVSEYGWPLPQAPNPDPGDSGGGYVIINLDNFYPSGIAIAKPRLDAKGLLVFDGSDSINAHVYHWTVQDLSSGATYSKDGAVVATEDIPPGLCQVTLDCTGSGFVWPPTPAVDSTTTFYIVIPPRIALAAREVDGALHIRWSPEIVGGKWNWCFYLSGHVFDEIGTAVFNHTVSNLEAWVTVNGERLNLTLDSSGAFLTRYVAGVRLADAYDLVLTAKTLDDAQEYEADHLHETRLTIFPPWLRYYFPSSSFRLGAR